MKKIFAISLIAMTAVTAANAEIASKAYVDQERDVAKAYTDTKIGNIGDNADVAAAIAAAVTGANLSQYELKTNVTSKGDATHPVYFDENGVAQQITSYAGNAATATSAASADAVAWSGVTGTPTTLAGYGITDAQGSLTFDNAPTENSTNPVKSGGVYTALAAKADSADLGALATKNSVGTSEIDANAVTLAKLSATLPSGCQASGAECVLKSSNGALAWEVIQRATGE